MIRFRKFLLLMAVLVGAVILGMPAPARASFVLALSEDGGPATTVTTGNTGPAVFSGVIGDFVIAVTIGTSNSPGGANGLTQASSINVTNTSSGTHVLHIAATAQGFTSPQSPPPLTVSDTVSGSVLTGSITGIDFQGFADKTNALFGTGFASQFLSIPTTLAAHSFSKDGSATGFSPNGATYSMSIFENLQFTGGTSITQTGGNVQDFQAVPAPPALVLLLTALPFLAFGWYYSRRRAVTQLAH